MKIRFVLPTAVAVLGLSACSGDPLFTSANTSRYLVAASQVDPTAFDAGHAVLTCYQQPCSSRLSRTRRPAVNGTCFRTRDPTCRLI
jgi:hypothetical protein